MSTVTISVRIFPTKEQEKLLKEATVIYIQTVNQLVRQFITASEPIKFTSKTVYVSLPSAVKNQAIRDAKSVYAKVRKSKGKIVPILTKPICQWNNQNYRIEENQLSLPFIVDGKSKRISIATPWHKHPRYDELKKAKLGTLRITKKNKQWVAQVSIEIEEKVTTHGMDVLGVDLGIKVPAVAVTTTGKTKFFGNGRYHKFKRRYYASKRQRLGKKKKLTTIKKLNQKEQRWMTNQDHVISRQIVDFAIGQNVSTIRLEQLANIRQTTRTSRKNAKNLHKWSFHRLQGFITYKAQLAGICVEVVNPKYTSQSCPTCGTLNKTKTRSYRCACGYQAHRDRVGAINIIKAPVISGNSLSA